MLFSSNLLLLSIETSVLFKVVHCTLYMDMYNTWTDRSINEISGINYPGYPVLNYRHLDNELLVQI